MNYDKLKTYISAYKENFDQISKQELYKWQAVKQFQDHWDDQTDDIVQMLETSLAKTENLLHDSKMMARGTLLLMAKKKPLLVMQALNILWNEELSLENRYKLFSDIIRPIALELDGVNNHHHRHRALFVYLCLNYPEKYFLYKYGMVKEAVRKLDYPLTLKKGSWSNVYGYFNLCELILPVVRKDDELLRLHFSRLDETCYQDPEQHILVQDIIYAIAVHLDEIQVVNNDKSYDIQAVLKAKPAYLNFNNNSSQLVQTDFERLNQTRHQLGAAAELFVYKIELEKARRIGKEELVEYTARDKGDGAGYDIKSIDENGDERLIEVKATSSSLETPFYITRNELELSKQNPGNYYLYRVFNFDRENHSGEIAIFQGSLDQLCQQPATYISKLIKA
ncbi:hypothetical protein JCM19294_1244 [Nonlabens tegetincola]|uniref:Protein NO VEIN C-terminal domain-containing protein n=1 Tax=Nonlabens tegetincola TaxID=323273 RepID=A0A090Q1M9_9FLAO|nr:DUF3883 domain-containing protein [Nonlabens tegetincola]GAK96935.1 hypothetical protein JCM19294_1244 [Nonlabens tegetincola]